MPDAGPDSGDAGDGGVITACPDLDTATEGATGVATQEVIITRLVFEADNIRVTFRAINGDFNFADPLVLCTGSEDDDCDDGVQLLVDNPDGGIGIDLAEGEEVEFLTNAGGVTAAAGELALINGLPSVEPGDGQPDTIVRAYVNWGNYTSLAPSVGNNGTLEARASDQLVWSLGETVDVGGNTTVFATGDVTSADGFEVCTAP